jgi:hypothetical protein
LLVTSMEVPSSVVPVWRLEIKAGPIWAFTRPIGPSGLGRPRLKPGAGVHRCGWSCPCRRRWEVAVLRQVWRWSGCVSISSVWCLRTMALRLQRWVLRWQRCESTRRCCPNPSRCGTQRRSFTGANLGCRPPAKIIFLEYPVVCSVHEVDFPYSLYLARSSASRRTAKPSSVARL